MKIVTTQDDLQKPLAECRGQNKTIGFVPTMGALHDGHLSLVDIARKNADVVAVSIFVNPAQFAPHEDLDRYPRPLENDLRLLRQRGVDIVWTPAVGDIYPKGPAADRKAGTAAQGLESVIRPHFFDGVVSVVWRLFSAVKPDLAVFGEKDYQQLEVIKEMVAAENLPIKIIPGPIARDEYGLALSSRNAYLTPAQLEIARKLNTILFAAAQNKNSDVTEQAKHQILAAGFDEVQYLEARWGRLLAAVRLGDLRLIDNVEMIYPH